MCEWLSSGEWCDVKLVCDGRTFNAHRAVLASVSVFLRRVLLSCPSQEDTPVFIVLPDFDLEAMSSVLYYVYNGEVLIDNRKLITFLDIVKTLEIFIDHQYLQKLRYNVDDGCLDLLTYPKSTLLTDELSLDNSNDHENANIESERIQNKFQFIQNRIDQDDNKDTCRSRSDLHPTMPYLDRQRNSFLRDLYIETYPQNGNVNGVTGGVLAISNERYRTPTSVLLKNANGKLPTRAADRISESSSEQTESDFLPNMFRKQSYVKGFDQAYNDITTKNFFDAAQWTTLGLSKCKLFMGSSYNYDWNIRNSKHLIKYERSHSNTQLLREMQERNPMSSLDLSLTQSFVGSVVANSNNFLEAISLTQTNVNSNYMKNDIQGKSNNFSKVPIFNQVIDSPWRPRLPNNYKPFRRKGKHVTVTAPTKKDNVAVENDKNNNNVEQMTKILTGCVNESLPNKLEHRCAMCNQVFVNEESLAVHTKRHTTPPRYSCSECGKTFSQLRNFKYHVSVHRGTREFAATCTVCGKYFNDRGYLSSHMKIHRNRKEYKCSLCPKSFNQRVAYNMHVRIHTGVKPHVCDECGKAFSRKMLLKQHQRTHSGERPYACPHCDKRFADRSNMTLHLRLHTGVKPFSCTLCPKSFTKKHHLKSHLNFHTGAKPYSCPRCKLAFTQSSNMRTHLKKCTAIPSEENASSI
ncbi:unnamed protein product [Chilo suppressalis]|uniref:BTB domain-containing protein n=1 Tax=Chilo suppressalis TaxID=168631 RepID=A0ABN8BJU1_CHISP|nr:unnamed protein product [Chilo suppressalis]